MATKGLGEILDNAGIQLGRIMGIKIQEDPNNGQKQKGPVKRTSRETVYDPETKETKYVEDGAAYDPEADGFNERDANRFR